MASTQQANFPDTSDPAERLKAVTNPTWDDDILPLLQKPYWPSNEDIGCMWQSQMQQYGPWDLFSYEDVKPDAVSIYQHLRCRSMPIVDDEDEYWPEEALELLRIWINQGYRKASTDSALAQAVEIIPQPTEPPVIIRVRKDIKNLTDTELQTYRSCLDDILNIDSLGSKWQEIGGLHAHWCLHYQEGFILWHRAMLKYVEELIDFPIPYWNVFADDFSDPNNPDAGIPQVFLEETYEHPMRGTRPNPLKYALTLDGFNKTTKQKYVTRDATLVAGPSSPDWAKKIGLVKGYHQQISNAFAQPLYSQPEEGGYAWAAILMFREDMREDEYMYLNTFDGLFEQAHDNFHGWIGGQGGDMSDNTYTGFDPILLSYHANVDRLAASWMRAHPQQQYSSNFPLQPFTDNAKNLNYSDPRLWIYTTIGDMAKPLMALGYIYGPTNKPDHQTLDKPKTAANAPRGGDSTNIISRDDLARDETSKRTVPWIVFPDVACTTESFYIDVWVHGAAEMTVDHNNPYYIGRITRLGMGTGSANGGLKNKSRCQKPTVSRALPLKDFTKLMEAAEWEVLHLVTSVATGQVIPPDETKGWGGFVGKVVWAL